jgi:hypothetical protein
MSFQRRAASSAVAAVLLLSLAACSPGDTTDQLRGTGKIKPPVVRIPSQILGLRVAREDVSEQVKAVKRPYVDSVGMFSLREGDLLRATLQISRFNGLARQRLGTVRASTIGLTGSSKPLEIQVDDTLVYSTSGNEQNIFVWFKGNGYYVLSVHRQYEFPRTLLRRAVGLPVTL